MPAKTKSRGRGRPRQYEWAAMFKRKAFILRKGEDYQCPTSSMIQQLRSAASEHGVGCSITENGADTISVVITKGKRP